MAKAKSEAGHQLEATIEDILGKLDGRVRRPLEEITAFFEWLKLVEFTSATNEALTAAALSSEMEKLGPNMFRPEDQVRALSRTLKEYRTRITELAKKTE
jgi:hypothetical protein